MLRCPLCAGSGYFTETQLSNWVSPLAGSEMSVTTVMIWLPLNWDLLFTCLETRDQLSSWCIESLRASQLAHTHRHPRVRLAQASRLDTQSCSSVPEGKVSGRRALFCAVIMLDKRHSDNKWICEEDHPPHPPLAFFLLALLCSVGGTDST